MNLCKALYFNQIFFLLYLLTMQNIVKEKIITISNIAAINTEAIIVLLSTSYTSTSFSVNFDVDKEVKSLLVNDVPENGGQSNQKCALKNLANKISKFIPPMGSVLYQFLPFLLEESKSMHMPSCSHKQCASFFPIQEHDEP